ncbi:MAG: hypothetical protein Q4G26_00210 [Paracoccus sp. (in: a-proteobacteria)]|nr:hypothetical protein [Paracoccus sp. (in: a-proteobacteria)]
MQKNALRLSGASLLIAILAACQPSPYGGTTISPDAQRAVGGALVGAAIAKATDGNMRTGALIGAGAGALCDDVGVCQRSY